MGGAAPAWLSAANEVAVEAFLADRINWFDIIPVVEATMSHFDGQILDSLSSLYENDETARKCARASLKR